LSDLVVNPSGTRVGGVLKDGSVYIWDAKTGVILKELNVGVNFLGGKKAEKPQLITTMDISNRYIVTYGMNDEVKLIDSAHYQDIKNWKMTAMQHITKDPSKGHPNVQISRLKITPDEKYIIFSTNVEGWIGIIDIAQDKIVRFKLSENYKDTKEWPSCFIVSNNSKHLIVGNDEGVVSVFAIKAIMQNKPLEEPAINLTKAKETLAQLNSSLTSLAIK